MVTIAFWIALLLTVFGLLLTVRSGRQAQRQSHLIRALVTIVLLTIAVFLALELGQQRDFPERPMAIHKIFSRSAAYLVLPVVISGCMLWRRPKWRFMHRLFVYLFLFAALCATGTGIWAFSLSTPLP